MKAKAVYRDYEGVNQLIGYKIMCLGCGHPHILYANKNVYNSVWMFNGDFEKPTFSPSLKCTTGSLAQPQFIDPPNIPPTCCHSFIRNGQMQYLNDCTHFLKGHTVNLPDIV